MIQFMKFRWLYFALSALVILPGIVSLVLFGLRPSIDFTGGTELELKIIDKNHNAITEDALKKETEGVLDIREVTMLKNSHVLLKALSVDVAKKHLKEREDANLTKWKRMYGVNDFWDPKYYDLVINTYSHGPTETLDIVLQALGYYNGNH